MAAIPRCGSARRLCDGTWSVASEALASPTPKPSPSPPSLALWVVFSVLFPVSKLEGKSKTAFTIDRKPLLENIDRDASDPDAADPLDRDASDPDAADPLDRDASDRDARTLSALPAGLCYFMFSLAWGEGTATHNFVSSFSNR